MTFVKLTHVVHIIETDTVFVDDLFNVVFGKQVTAKQHGP